MMTQKTQSNTISLADLAPISKTLSLRGKAVVVYPLSLGAIGGLMARFDNLRGLLAGADMVATISQAGDAAVAAVIAAALRDPAAEVAAAHLPLSEQMRIITSCLEMTLPQDEAEVGEVAAEALKVALRLGLLARAAARIADAAVVPVPASGPSSSSV